MSYTVVVDLEMCKVLKQNRRDYHFGDEIIQIGTTCLDENYEVVDGFNCFVKPQYGYIDQYIQKLTGITSANVAHAKPLNDAINEFMEWIPDNSVMVSWSMTDKSQFVRETSEKHIVNDKFEKLLENWVDCQLMFSEKMNTKRQFSLSEALLAADIDSLGNEHDGESDAYNTALLYKKILTDPEFRLNSYYAQAKEENTEHLTSTMSDLLSKITVCDLVVA